MAATASSPAASTSAMAAACVVLALCAAAGAPVATAGLMCTTNSTSPTQTDASVCVLYVRNLANQGKCCQSATPGYGCTTLYYWGTAAVDLCGYQNDCASCIDIANNLNTIVNECSSTAWRDQSLVAGSQFSGYFTSTIRQYTPAEPRNQGDY